MTSHTHVAILHTNHGAIKVNLFGLAAPVTVANFIGLADGTKEWTHPRTGAKNTNKPLYSGVIFHRIIPGFMIQGGDPTGTGMGGPGYNFNDEISEQNFKEPYKLAMANAGPGTNGSQFFITVAETGWLYGKHTVFGEVADDVSRSVVDKIAAVPTGPGDKPLDDVIIESITIEEVVA
ncbi:MAG: peptidylprolyl isomerase [Micrococcales bacterium]|nr:peptidylprolyl isomerase [Actinomycetota bacterium]NCA07685.1 peptidylprolyl isomerase [Micrococcales bacterium]